MVHLGVWVKVQELSLNLSHELKNFYFLSSLLLVLILGQNILGHNPLEHNFNSWNAHFTHLDQNL